MSTAEQVRCPSCGGAQEIQDTDRYECRFCLTPFTYRHAQEVEDRQLAEIKAWVEQRIGGQAAAGDGGIDASSRAYLFRRNLLPSLQTAHDRALEATFGFEQYPLLPAVRPDGQDTHNPLLRNRDEVLQLRELRARLASPDVQTFAVTEDDRARIAALDQRLAEIVGLSNAAHAAAQGTAQGFAAARHNLEGLLAAGGLDADVADRYRALARLAELMERALGTGSLSGETLAQEADTVAAELARVAGRLERQGTDGGESLAAIAARKEAARAGDLARWLRSYDAIVRRADLPFLPFVRDTLEILGQQSANGRGVELVETCAQAFRALRGEVAVPAHEVFDWVRPLADGSRKGRWLRRVGLGFLGLSEDVVGVEEFYAPFWLIEAGGTRWLVDAADAAGASPLLLEQSWQDLRGWLSQPVPLKRQRGLPAPTVTAAQAVTRVQETLSTRGMHNARLEAPVMAMLPAAKFEYRTGRGRERVAVSCLSDRLPLKQEVLLGLAATRRLQERFQ